MGFTMIAVGHWQVVATLPPTMERTVGDGAFWSARLWHAQPNTATSNSTIGFAAKVPTL
jgi:hypothetical protein